MKKLLLLFILIPFISIGQVQIGQDINGEAKDDLSGHSVSISSDGSVVAIGARSNSGNAYRCGHARIYENIGGVWTQIGQDINGDLEEDFLGDSISLNANGSIVAIGAPQQTNPLNLGSGYVRVYENIGGVWIQIGQDINSEFPGDNFGGSISLNANGNVLAIGASLNDGNGGASGHTRIYENIGGIWTQIGQDINGDQSDQFGFSVSLNTDGNVLAIGAIENVVNGFHPGYVRVYENIGGVWTQIGQDINGEQHRGQFGWSISMS